MSMVIDAVLSAHDSHLCGVTRFNRKLAGKLGVPHALLKAPVGAYPLVSVKPDEIHADQVPPSGPYALFLHGYDETVDDWVDDAHQVFVANPELAVAVPGARVAWCPETLGNDPYPVLASPPQQITVFATGMAHKAQWDKHERLAEWLRSQRMPWWVLVSAGFHEGMDLSHDQATLTDGLQACYGSKGLYLGFLSNAMTRGIMASSDMVACFFPDGVRQNHTTAMAALRMGCPVVTTFDAWSPYGLSPGVQALDLDDLPDFDRTLWRNTGEAAQVFMSQWYTWEGLVEVLTMDLPTMITPRGTHA